MKQDKKKLLIFDMDGTLYTFKEGSFSKSVLRKKVLENASHYIAKKLNKSKSETRDILEYIEVKYGEDISLALEKEYGINKNDYFNVVWNISAKGIVKRKPRLREFLLKIREKYSYALVSDAPIIWMMNVLKELDVEDIFKNKIYSGEGRLRKVFGNSLQFVASELMFKPENCIVVGDQENTDIVQAKNNGMLAVLISEHEKITEADYVIKDIFGLRDILKL